jgi:XTP/dITP diphosphohydrolase
MSELERLKLVMDRLRSPGGCPWDMEQTHESILKYLIEECYEFIDAVNSKDIVAMQEELGDILLQVYFHSRIAQENPESGFTVEEVAKGVADKIIERHPHVFSDAKVSSSEEVLLNWEKAKQAEKGRTSPFDGVPRSQPALALAAKALYRLDKLEIPYEIPKTDKLEFSKMSQDLLDQEITSENFGELLFSLISVAVAKGIEPESALRGATVEFMKNIESEIAQNLSMKQSQDTEK